MKMYLVVDTDGKSVCGADTKEEAIRMAQEERPGEVLIGVVREGKKEVAGFMVGKLVGMGF